MRVTGMTAVAAAAALAAGVVAAPAASAAIVFELAEDVDVTFPIVCDRGTPDEADDLTLEQRVTGTARFRVKQRGPDGGLWFEGRNSFSETTTNLDNGISWSATVDQFEHETHALEVLDETTRRLVVSQHLRFRVYDPSGTLDSQRVGVRQVELIVDTRGTPDPFDDEIEFVDIVRTAGKDDVSADVCDDAVRFTAG